MVFSVNCILWKEKNTCAKRTTYDKRLVLVKEQFFFYFNFIPIVCVFCFIVNIFILISIEKYQSKSFMVEQRKMLKKTNNRRQQLFIVYQEKKRANGIIYISIHNRIYFLTQLDINIQYKLRIHKWKKIMNIWLIAQFKTFLPRFLFWWNAITFCINKV